MLKVWNVSHWVKIKVLAGLLSFLGALGIHFVAFSSFWRSPTNVGSFPPFCLFMLNIYSQLGKVKLEILVLWSLILRAIRDYKQNGPQVFIFLIKKIYIYFILKLYMFIRLIWGKDNLFCFRFWNFST